MAYCQRWRCWAETGYQQDVVMVDGMAGRHHHVGNAVADVYLGFLAKAGDIAKTAKIDA